MPFPTKKLLQVEQGSLFSTKIDFFLKADFGILSFFYKNASFYEFVQKGLKRLKKAKEALIRPIKL